MDMLLSTRGFVHPADYIVRVNVPIQHKDGSKNNEWTSVVSHELAHYFQITSTSVGYRISQLSRFISGWRGLLLKYCPKVYMPASRWIHEDSSLTSKPETQIILERLSNYTLEYEALCTAWPNTAFLPFIDPRTRRIDIDYFRREKPITLDPREGTMKFRMPGGRQFTAIISGYQIMESMASLVQMQHDGWVEKNWRMDFIEACTDMLRLQYNLPMLYMLQEGITGHPGGMAFLHDYLMCASQVCLMLNPHTLQVYGEGRYENVIDRLDPGRVYLDFLLRSDIGNVFFMRVLTSERSWLEICDEMSHMLGVPPYSYMVELAIKEALEEKRMATDANYNRKISSAQREELEDHGIEAGEVRLPLAESRGKQIDIGIQALRRLLQHPEYILYPTYVFDTDKRANTDGMYIPTPPILGVDGQLLVRAGDAEIWEASVYQQYVSFITSKVFHDTDIACYHSLDGTDQVFPCPDFGACRKRVKSDILSFCTNKKWCKIVSNALKYLKITDCTILDNQ